MTAALEGLRGWFSRRRADDRPRTETGTTATTGGGKGSEPVVVWEARTHLEAEIVKGRLASVDIPASFRGEVLGQIYGLTTGQLAATAVLVPAPLAEKALTLLYSEPEWETGEEFDEV